MGKAGGLVEGGLNRGTLHGVMEFNIIFGCPFLILVWPGLKKWPGGFLGRFLTAVIAGWGLLIGLSEIERVTRYPLSGVNDGCAASAFTFAFGWIPACAGCLPATMVALLLKRRPAKKEGSEAP